MTPRPPVARGVDAVLHGLLRASYGMFPDDLAEAVGLLCAEHTSAREVEVLLVDLDQEVLTPIRGGPPHSVESSAAGQAFRDEQPVRERTLDGVAPLAADPRLRRAGRGAGVPRRATSTPSTTGCRSRPSSASWWCRRRSTATSSPGPTTPAGVPGGGDALVDAAAAHVQLAARDRGRDPAAVLRRGR